MAAKHAGPKRPVQGEAVNAKLKRRLRLLDDSLDALLRTPCQFFACGGPEAPIRDMCTCYRCAILHRAAQMGLIKFCGDVVEQYSVINGKRIEA